jgi:hypothetical protein
MRAISTPELHLTVNPLGPTNATIGWMNSDIDVRASTDFISRILCRAICGVAALRACQHNKRKNKENKKK